MNEWEVTIPEQIDGEPVTTIERKAFLSRKTLQRVTLPRTIREVGDWAFAHCTHLTEVRWSGAEAEQPIHFGKAVFLDCPNLRFLYARDGRESTAALLAAAVTAMDAEFLLDYDAAGSPEWLAQWDARLRTILRTPDSDGFARELTCGEEDYGNTDQEAYESARRCAKVRLLFLRLFYPEGLDETFRAEAEDYLRNLTAGCPHDETWRIILREHPGDSAWYRLFAELGCVTAENFDRILADLGEEHPETKAYFLRWKSDNLAAPDFFAGLAL